MREYGQEVTLKGVWQCVCIMVNYTGFLQTCSTAIPTLMLYVLFLSVETRQAQQLLTATTAHSDPPQPRPSGSVPSNSQLASGKHDTSRGAQAQATDTTGLIEKGTLLPVAEDGGRARRGSQGISFNHVCMSLL